MPGLSTDSVSTLAASLIPQGLCHLELTDVSSISDTGLVALRSLTRLEHLVVRMSRPPQPPPPASSRGWASTSAAAMPPKAPVSTVTHASLGTLRTASTLRHLEWSLGEPLTDAELAPALSIISSLGNLQHVALDVDPELRIARNATGGSGASASGREGAGSAAVGSSAKALPEARQATGKEVDSDSEEDEEDEDAEPVPWHEQLEAACPLVQATDRPGVVMYSLWADCTLNLTSR